MNSMPAFSAPVNTRLLHQNRKYSPRCHNLKRVLVVCGRDRRTAGFGESETKMRGADSRDLEDWAASKNVEMGKVQLSTFDKNLRGMRAVERIESNSALLSVPSSIAIAVDTLDVSRSPFPEILSTDVWKGLAWYGRLALKLYLKRHDPIWMKWISLLPKSFDTPIYWKDSDINELQCAEIIRVVKKRKDMYREMFNKVSNQIESMRYEEFAWALDCVFSRSFEGPCEVASFRDRFQLALFVLANTFIWPSFGVLDLNQALNGVFLFPFLTFAVF